MAWHKRRIRAQDGIDEPMNSFISNGDVVLHLLLVVAGIMACFIAVGAVVFMLTRVVERDCRREMWYDEDGRRK